MDECFYCGRLLYDSKKPKVVGTGSIIDKLLPPPSIAPKDWPRRTRDHTIPKSRGGGQDQTIVSACGDCNQEKGRLTIEEYRAVLAFRYGYLSNVLYKFAGEQ